MFYITKHLRGKPRRYLYEAYRDKKTGKAKRRLVAYLGDFKTLRERLAYKSAELVKAKKREAELRRILEPSLIAFRKLRDPNRPCPSWEEIRTMPAYARRISFFLPGAYEASRQIGKVQEQVSTLEPEVERLRAILPRIIVAPK